MRNLIIALSSALAVTLVTIAIAAYFKQLGLPRVALAQLAEASTWQYFYHNTRLVEFSSWIFGATLISALLAGHRTRKLNTLQTKLYEAAVDAQATRAQMEHRA